MIRSLWRSLHSAHPLLRLVIGGFLAVIAWSWLVRAAHASDPIIHAANRFIGWCGLLLAIWLSLPGLWIAARELWSGLPSTMKGQNVHGAARRATADEIQRGLTGKSLSSSRPKPKRP